MEKTIFISIYDGDTEKNVLRSGTLERLKAAGHRIVLLIRQQKRLEYYRREFGGDAVRIELLPFAGTFGEVLWNHIGWNSIPTYSVYLRRHDMYVIHKQWWRYAFERLLGILGRMRVWRELLRLAYYIVPDAYAQDLFETYRPDLVFAPNMFSAEDCRLLKAANKRGIRTVTTVKSWDVLTTKAFTRVRADRILVFNQYNKEEAIRLGDYRPECVTITGFPQFDIYSDPNILEPRETFCAKVGIDPAHAIILFAIPGDWKMAFTDEVVKHIDDAISDGRIKGPATVLARVHPKYPSKVERRSDYRHVKIERPGTYFSHDQERSLDTSAAKTLAWTFTNNDIIHLANSIYHSAVVINIESTMTLDAAAFSRPSILVGYDGDHMLSYLESIVRNYDRNHYQYVMKTGGVRLAKTKDDLITDINRSLFDPMADADGMKRLQDTMLYALDGKAAERTAKAILGEL